MKFFRTALLLVLVAVWINVSAQNEGRHYDIKGIWKVDLPGTIRSMDEQEQEKYESMPERARNNMQNVFQERVYQFNEDNTVNVRYTAGEESREIKGHWTYDAGTRILVIKGKNSISTYTVNWKNNKDIQLKYMKTSPVAILKQLCLIRN